MALVLAIGVAAPGLALAQDEAASEAVIDQLTTSTDKLDFGADCDLGEDRRLCLFALLSGAPTGGSSTLGMTGVTVQLNEALSAGLAVGVDHLARAEDDESVTSIGREGLAFLSFAPDDEAGPSLLVAAAIGRYGVVVVEDPDETNYDALAGAVSATAGWAFELSEGVTVGPTAGLTLYRVALDGDLGSATAVDGAMGMVGLTAEFGLTDQVSLELSAAISQGLMGPSTGLELETEAEVSARLNERLRIGAGIEVEYDVDDAETGVALTVGASLSL